MEISRREIGGGFQVLHRFPNGYGASVVCHERSYGGPSGLWELAVIRWHADAWEIDCSTDITGDVLGYLTDSDVSEVLSRIEEL